MFDRDRMITQLLRMLTELGWMPPSGDWVDAFASGDAIRTDEAAFIARCSAQTVRRRAAEALAAGRPIGILISQSVWLISLPRWLDDIERQDGLPGRVEAEARLTLAEKRKNGRAAPKFDSGERAATG